MWSLIVLEPYCLENLKQKYLRMLSATILNEALLLNCIYG